MKRVCPYDEITPISLIGCHECGFRLVCAEYEEQLRASLLYIRMGNLTRICGKRIMMEDWYDIHVNKTKQISNSIWHWTSNEELLKDVVLNK